MTNTKPVVPLPTQVSRMGVLSSVSEVSSACQGELSTTEHPRPGWPSIQGGQEAALPSQLCANPPITLWFTCLGALEFYTFRIFVLRVICHCQVTSLPYARLCLNSTLSAINSPTRLLLVCISK